MIKVAGGVYLERCIQPHWDQLFGSGGRAAVALSTLTEVELSTYVDDASRRDLGALVASVGGITLRAAPVRATVRFDYVHPLSIPVIRPAPHVLPRVPSLTVEGEVVLRFGMIEGDAIVRGKRVIYDPQSATNPVFFGANGSTADQLAIVLNAHEVRLLTGESDLDAGAWAVLEKEAADVVVVKRGAHGAQVLTRTSRQQVPAYRSELVFGIGSGDIFAASFAYFWGVEGRGPEEAADVASRCTARYCGSRSTPLPSDAELHTLKFEPVRARPGRIYLAGPFFSLAQRWLIEEARTHLLGMGQAVFSPIHDVGAGPAEQVAPADLAEFDKCDRVLALLDGADVGTVFEVGFARARGLPVVALAENLSQEQLKMIVGSQCNCTDDFATALYLTSWI